MAFETKEEDNVTGKVIGLILFLLIAGTLLERSGILNSFSSSFNVTKTNTIADISPNRIFPSGDIQLGDGVFNKRKTVVRNQPGGEALGTQPVRESAQVIEGPVNRFDSEWWRLDYPSAPDGWILKSDITNNTFWFQVLNIIPITYSILQPFLIIVSLIVFVLIIWISFKRHDLRKLNEKKKMLEDEQGFSQEVKEGEGGGEGIDNLPTGSDAPKTEDVHNRRWANVQSLINSHSVNDWRQAIIEADVILEEMLDKMGYKGDSIGDKLKTVEKSDFLTLDKAWEAHKIRNRIAHKGSDYVLTKNDAEKAINAYTEVFKEFYFI